MTEFGPTLKMLSSNVGDFTTLTLAFLIFDDNIVIGIIIYLSKVLLLLISVSIRISTKCLRNSFTSVRFQYTLWPKYVTYKIDCFYLSVKGVRYGKYGESELNIYNTSSKF